MLLGRGRNIPSAEEFGNLYPIPIFAPRKNSFYGHYEEVNWST